MGQTWPQPSRSGWSGQAMNTPDRRPKAPSFSLSLCFCDRALTQPARSRHVACAPLMCLRCRRRSRCRGRCYLLRRRNYGCRLAPALPPQLSLPFPACSSPLPAPSFEPLVCALVVLPHRRRVGLGHTRDVQSELGVRAEHLLVYLEPRLVWRKRATALLAHGPGLAAGLQALEHRLLPHAPARASPRPADAPTAMVAAARAASTAAAWPSASSAPVWPPPPSPRPPPLP